MTHKTPLLRKGQAVFPSNYWETDVVGHYKPPQKSPFGDASRQISAPHPQVPVFARAGVPNFQSESVALPTLGSKPPVHCPSSKVCGPLGDSGPETRDWESRAHLPHPALSKASTEPQHPPQHGPEAKKKENNGPKKQQETKTDSIQIEK